MKIGYARVSREDQNTGLQRDALKTAGCAKIFEDRITGATFTRKGLARALRTLGPGDELVVWKLDRLGRSMLETITVVLNLDRRGITFRSLTESFDTKTAIGRGVLAFIAAVAEDERERIRERTAAGMAAAKRRGAILGRPRKLSAEQIAMARKLLKDESETRAQVAARLGVDPGTLRRALRRPR
jgi:DNA invertase Pin-like site-specific DNA recombinase